MTKTINELLIALKKEFNSYRYSGLCIAITHTTYSADEQQKLNLYLKKACSLEYTYFFTQNNI